MDKYFSEDTDRTDGFIKFVSDNAKVPFATEVVPKLDKEHFKVFTPIFEFIENKIEEASSGHDKR